MKTILSVAKRDITKIAKNRAALIVITALIFLPSLYAWFNIKASWDPYANTEGVTVAITSLDSGAVINNKDINIGDEVIINLTENDDLGWLFISEEEAIKGVEHGDYYAAIIIPADFSEKLVSVTTDEIEKPQLDYYINEKINAISPKVTKSGASAIVENIHTSFLKEVNETIGSVFNAIGLELEHNYVDIERAKDAIYRLEDEMPNIYANLQIIDKNLDLADVAMESVHHTLDNVENFHARAEQLNHQIIRRLKTNEATVEQVIQSMTDHLKKTKQTINSIPRLTTDFSEKGNTDLSKLIDSLNSRQQKLNGAADRLTDIHDYLQKQNDQLKKTTKITELHNSLNKSEQNLRQLNANLQQIVRNIETGNHPAVSVIEQTNELVRSFDEHLKSLSEMYESTITPQIQLSIEQMEQFRQTINGTFEQILIANNQALQYILQLIENSEKDYSLKERLDTAAILIERNLERVDRIVLILKVMTTISDNERIENLFIQFESLHERLVQAEAIVNDILQLYEKGENINETILSRLADTLQNVHDKVEDVSTEFDTKTEQAINDVITQLKQVNIHLTERFNDLKQIQTNVQTLLNDLEEIIKNPEKTLHIINKIIDQVDNGIHIIDSIQSRLEDMKQFIESDVLGSEIERILLIRDEVLNTNESIGIVINRIEDAKKTGSDRLKDVDNLASSMEQSIEEVIQFINGKLLNNYKLIIENATTGLQDVSNVLNDIDKKLPTLEKALTKADEGIKKGHEKLNIANEHFPEAKVVVNELANKIRELEEKGDLDQLINLLQTDPIKVSEFLAEPILLNEHELYPIPNYGSAMNPFYTTLALWVGGLLLISSLKVDIDDKKEFKSYEVYGGRLLTFLGIGLLQSLIVTLGNIFLLNAYTVNKFFYVLFGMLISLVFMTIIYTLVSVFGNTGKVFAIILLVMQLGGSGGTFPIQMAPPFFQKIYTFVPFTHAISLLRESIGGIIWNVALKHIFFLIAYFIIALVLGISLKRIVNKSSDEFTKKARESEIVI